MSAPTLPLTIDVDAEAAKAYLDASPETRRKLQLLLELRLQEIVKPPTASLHEILNRIANQAEARGLTPELLQSIVDEESISVRFRRQSPRE